MENNDKLKKHVLSLINDNMNAHVVKEILNIEIHSDPSVKNVVIECKMMNDKIKKCVINRAVIMLIQQPLIQWI